MHSWARRTVALHLLIKGNAGFRRCRVFCPIRNWALLAFVGFVVALGVWKWLGFRMNYAVFTIFTGTIDKSASFAL